MINIRLLTASLGLFIASSSWAQSYLPALSPLPPVSSAPVSPSFSLTEQIDPENLRQINDLSFIGSYSRPIGVDGLLDVKDRSCDSKVDFGGFGLSQNIGDQTYWFSRSFAFSSNQCASGMIYNAVIFAKTASLDGLAEVDRKISKNFEYRLTSDIERVKDLASFDGRELGENIGDCDFYVRGIWKANTSSRVVGNEQSADGRISMCFYKNAEGRQAFFGVYWSKDIEGSPLSGEDKETGPLFGKPEISGYWLGELK